MKAKRLSEEQTIGVLRESEAEAKSKDLCRKYGISEPAFYSWKAKHAGTPISAARPMKNIRVSQGMLAFLARNSNGNSSWIFGFLNATQW